MASASSIAAAIEAIPGKKEALRRAFDDVQAHPSSLAPFTLHWGDLDDHLSSLERSVEGHFRELESREKERSPPAAAGGTPELRIREVESTEKERFPAAASSAPVGHPQTPEKDARPAAEQEEPDEEEAEEEEPEEEAEEKEPDKEEPEVGEPEAELRPDIRSFCVKMDGRGLRAFIAENHEDLTNIEGELDQAMRAAADPAGLVLDAMDGFYPDKPRGALGDAALLKNRRACILLLERLYAISPEIKPPIKKRAKQLAAEWKEKIPPEGGQERSLPFLQLLLSYGIVSEFKLDDVLEVLISVVGWKHAVELCRNLGISEKMPDFIVKLFVKKKKLEAVRFVYAFELVDKFPPVQLLKSYLRDCKKVAVQVRRKGKYSRMSQIEATSREIAAHRAVIKTIGDYKLESEFSPVVLQKRATELEHFKQQMIDQRKTEAELNAAFINPKELARQKKANKRLRRSTMVATAVATSLPLAPLSQTQPQAPLTDRASYLASNEPYSLSGSSYLYDHAAAAYTASPLGLGAVRSPPRSSLHSDPPTGSGLYDRSGVYCGYSLSGGFRQQ